MTQHADPMGRCQRCRITCPLRLEHLPNRCLDKDCPGLTPIDAESSQDSSIKGTPGRREVAIARGLDQIEDGKRQVSRFGQRQMRYASRAGAEIMKRQIELFAADQLRDQSRFDRPIVTRRGGVRAHFSSSEAIAESGNKVYDSLAKRNQ